MHRDVKLENFLIDLAEDGQMIVKLSDFGVARRFEEGKRLRGRWGSLTTIAPEMLKGSAYCHKIDNWALGVILHELLSTRLPFYADNDNDYTSNIINQSLELEDPTYWAAVPDEIKQLLVTMLDKDPITRVTIAQVLNHPWLSQFMHCVKHDDTDDFGDTTMDETIKLPYSI